MFYYLINFFILYFLRFVSNFIYLIKIPDNIENLYIQKNKVEKK